MSYFAPPLQSHGPVLLGRCAITGDLALGVHLRPFGETLGDQGVRTSLQTA
jgi:hypothetical protein